MKIHPVGAKLFHVDRQTDRESDRHDEINNCVAESYVPTNALLYKIIY